ncbi:FtsX-like permease family protein [Actinoplanes sp. NPDC020271]|uniref:ABC transporter permease n=1 Tax=Actinoplanes sp. NPDC020271 TaxID=3363896 RepID=UPI0037A265D5
MVTLSSLRARWATLAGAFVALGLGVALIATTGLGLAATLDAPAQPPERFAGAPVLVRGADELRVPARDGERVQPLAHPRAVPAGLVAELAKAGPVTADRSFPVDDGLVGHPWSVAAFGGYRLLAGHEPHGPAEVVVAGDATLVGRGLRVRTPAGVDGYTVAGVVAPVGYERAVFFTEGTAERLAPRVDNLVVQAPPDVVRAVVAGSGVQVLTGDERRRADPDPDRDREALTAMNALLGTAGGVTAFVSVFVVASTFAFAVAQRRQEIGLLRTAGATSGQIRLMIFAEAGVVGVLGSAAGCALATRGASLLARLLVSQRLAPGWFTIGTQHWPYHVAFWTGVAVALTGVAVATVRAGRVGPLEALREAAADTTVMTAGRWVSGAGLLIAGLGLLGWRLVSDPGEALHRKTYVTQPMLLICAVALLAPMLVRPLTRLIARLPGATGVLVRENVSTGVRRTAAVAAPVLVTVALAGSLLGTTATIDRAKARELSTQVAADLIVHGDDRDAATIRALPGTRVMTSADTAVYTLEEGVALVRSQATAVDPATLTAVRHLPVTAGRLGDLDDDGIVVNEEWAVHTVGDRVDVWLGDGTPRSLRIVAVLATGTGSNGVYVTARNSGRAPVDRLEVVTGDAAAVRAALRDSGARVSSRDQWLAEQRPAGNRQTRAGYFVVLGLALIYTGIAVATTTLAATADRTRDLAVLRLAGATRAQVLLVVAAETLTVVAVGTVLGMIVTLVNLGGVWAALATLSVWSWIVLPWPALVAAPAACAVVALIAALLAAAGALRARPMEMIRR